MFYVFPAINISLLLFPLIRSNKGSIFVGEHIYEKKMENVNAFKGYIIDDIS